MKATISQKMALATALLIVGLASSGCGRAGERLTAPAKPAASLSSTSLPGTYVWEFTWTAGTPNCGGSWYWQLSDSSWVLGGQLTGCSVQPSPMSGTGTIPLNAIAIQVSSGVNDGFCSDGKTVIKSLNNTQNLNITISSQLPSFIFVVDPYYGTKSKVLCAPASASFSLHS